MPLSQITTTLTGMIVRMVFDRTSLSGRWDFTLTFAPQQRSAPPPGVDGPSPADLSVPGIFTALQEQLGLKLESTKGPVEVLVIDAIEKPTED